MLKALFFIIFMNIIFFISTSLISTKINLNFYIMNNNKTEFF